jgi:hypothetical protein
MKIIKSSILGLSLVTLLFSCDTKEKARLQTKVDSLNVVVQASKQVETAMTEVGVLIDSIDANRKALRTQMVEGTSYANYIARLKDINNHMKETQVKLEQMEKANKNASAASNAAIRRLRNDLDLRSKEVVSLQLDIEKLRETNQNLWAHMNQKDSILSSRDEVIKVKDSDIASLQGLVKDTNEQNKIKVANLYFQQAQALETAANRTKFAPRKKKETRREALELYKLSNSMGNAEAQSKIDKLEKELS